MKAEEYNQFLHAIKETNSLPKDQGKPLQEKMRARMLADYGAMDEDVKRLYKQMRYVI